MADVRLEKSEIRFETGERNSQGTREAQHNSSTLASKIPREAAGERQGRKRVQDHR